MYVSMMPKDYHFDYLLANGLTEKAREGFVPSGHSKRALVWTEDHSLVAVKVTLVSECIEDAHLNAEMHRVHSFTTAWNSQGNQQSFSLIRFCCL